MTQADARRGHVIAVACLSCRRTPSPKKKPAHRSKHDAKEEKEKPVRTGTRTQNLLLRRQAPYPLGHTDNTVTLTTRRWVKQQSHSSLGVEHSLSKRKVVGSIPTYGSYFVCFVCFWFWKDVRLTEWLHECQVWRSQNMRILILLSHSACEF